MKDILRFITHVWGDSYKPYSSQNDSYLIKLSLGFIQTLEMHHHFSYDRIMTFPFLSVRNKISRSYVYFFFCGLYSKCNQIVWSSIHFTWYDSWESHPILKIDPWYLHSTSKSWTCIWRQGDILCNKLEWVCGVLSRLGCSPNSCVWLSIKQLLSFDGDDRWYSDSEHGPGRILWHQQKRENFK